MVKNCCQCCSWCFSCWVFAVQTPASCFLCYAHKLIWRMRLNWVELVIRLDGRLQDLFHFVLNTVYSVSRKTQLLSNESFDSALSVIKLSLHHTYRCVNNFYTLYFLPSASLQCCCFMHFLPISLHLSLSQTDTSCLCHHATCCNMYLISPHIPPQVRP